MTYKHAVTGFTLIPASGGCFEVTLDNDLIYSKLKTGQFPNEADLLTVIDGKLKK